MNDLAIWRLIPYGQYSGAMNMALDEALLEAVAEGRHPPTLRFYEWEPVCLSIGYMQKIREFDLDKLCERGYELVRRPSGGRAVLHHREVTYCLCVPEDDWRVAGGVIGSYKRLSRGFLRGLLALGRLNLEVSVVEKHGGSAACFDSPSRYEITARGRKMLGSAQWRHKGGVLQHGSIPLEGDVAELVDFLLLSDSERIHMREVLQQRAITVSDALGTSPGFDIVADSLANGLAEELAISWALGTFSTWELQRAEVLVGEKYANKDWNYRA